MASEPTQASPPPFTITQLRTRYLGPLVAFLLAVRVLAAFAWIGTTLPVTWDLSFPEAAIVARAVDVAEGDTPYHDWRIWPHEFAPYGPLTYYSAGWLALPGEHDSIENHVRSLGRIQSQLSLFGILCLGVAILRRLGVGRWWALLAAPAIISWESLFAYCASFRPDAPQVFFSLFALAIAMGGPPTKRSRCVAVLACLYLSLWFKATSWGIIATIVFWLWRGAGSRRAFLWLSGFALSGLIPVLILNNLWDGNLLLNMVGSLDNGGDIGNFRDIARKIQIEGWLVFFLGVGVSAVSWSKSSLDSPMFLFSTATLLTLLGTLAATLKVGADINYYLELYALCGIGVVYAVHRLWNLSPDDQAMAPGANLALRREIPLTILLLPFLVYQSGMRLLSTRDDIESNVARWKTPPVIEQIEKYQGEVLSVFPCVGLAAPGPEAILDHYQYRVLAERGLLDKHELLNRVRRKQFSAIVIEGTLERLPEKFFTDGFARELRENYRSAQDYNGQFTILVPQEISLMGPPFLPEIRQLRPIFPPTPSPKLFAPQEGDEKIFFP